MGSIFPMKEIDGRINETFLHGGEKQVIAPELYDPHREPTNLCNWVKKGRTGGSLERFTDGKMTNHGYQNVIFTNHENKQISCSFS